MVPLAGIILRSGAAALAAVAVLAIGSAASAPVEIRVFSSAASLEVQQAYGGQFARETGNRIALTAGTVRDIQERLAGPDKPDAVVLPAPIMKTLDEAGTFRPGSRVDLARVGIGIAVRTGSPVPDISTADALRKTLLAARTITHPDPVGGGIAGAQIARMFERLGIADALRPKVTLAYAFLGGVERVAKGEAEIGLFNISEILPVKGATLAGPLPPELQSYVVFSGAVHAGSAAPAAAAAYLQALAGPNARDLWHKGGFESLGKNH
jgi:molybdate transport system substrate-binding protein